MQNVDIDKIAKELAGGFSLDQLRSQQERLYDKDKTASISVPLTERGRKHLQSLRDPRLQSKPMRNTTKEMDYDTARKLFWRTMQRRADELSVIKNTDFQWHFSEDEKERIKNLLLYFINDESSAYPLNKGLFVIGPPGTGKSEMMSMLADFTTENKLSKAFEMTSMSGLYISAKTNSEFDPVTKAVQFNRCFDEFGRNLGAVMRFGDSININEAIIEQRYERTQRYGQYTHIISNMTTSEAAELLPPMIFDRIRELCTSVVFGGQSKRI